MHNKKTLIILSSAAMAVATFACLFAPKAMSFNSHAQEEYTCDLPVGFSEIDEIIGDAIAAGTTPAANTKSFRGTVTKVVGDYAYVQRKSQARDYVYGIRIQGVETYANSLAVGNVADFSNGYIYLDRGIATFVLSDSGDCVVRYNANPTGYNPVVFYDLSESKSTLSQTPQYQEDPDRPTNIAYGGNKLISVNNLVPVDYYGEQTWLDGQSLYEVQNITHGNSAYLVVDASFESFKADWSTAISQNKMLNITACYFQMAYFADDDWTIYIHLVSEDDYELGGTSIDTEVVNTISTSKYVLWVDSSEDYKFPFVVYTLNGHGDVPYVEFDNFYNNACAHRFFTGFWLSKWNDPYDEHIYYYYNNYYEYMVDAENNIIELSYDPNYYAYTDPNDYKYGFEVMAAGGNDPHIQVNYSNSLNFGEGHLLSWDLSRYNLDIVEDANRVVYFPLQALNIIFNDQMDGYSAVYNGKDLYWSNFYNRSQSEFWSDSPWYNAEDPTYTVSEAYAAYNYSCLCLSIEKVYGLAEYRGVYSTGINSADALFESMGLKSRLTSTNTIEFEEALVEFVGKWFYDGHSGFTSISPMNRKADVDWNTLYRDALDENSRNHQLMDTYQTLESLRNGAHKGVGLSVYEDTAIITFDSFIKYDFSLGDPSELDLSSYTYAKLHELGSELLFRKAFNEIEANKDIKNVVIDITMNGGGDPNTFPFLEAYMSNDPSITCYNRLTGYTNEIHYNTDLNYNDVFGEEEDTYQGKYNFYMMTSRFSFSCGNYYPTVVKEKAMATLIGQRSGGGTCVVSSLTTTYGSLLRNSGAHQVGSWDYGNNCFQNNEEGIPVDVEFDYHNFYNDEAIYNFIHTL